MTPRLVSLSTCAAAWAVVGALCSPPAAATPWGAAPELTAAYLFNVVKFVAWPAGAEASLALCVLNDPASEAALARLAAGNAIEGRSITVLRQIPRDRLRSCDLVYLSEDDSRAQQAMLAEVKDLRVLTVGNGKQFARRGGMVGLMFDDGRLRFAINPEAAQRSGLQISSMLLAMATVVRD